MTAAKRRIDILVTEKEFEILEQYCADNGQTKTAVMRELIRTLKAHTAARAFGGKLPPETSLAKAAESSQGG